MGKLMQDMNNTGKEGFNYEVLKDGVSHFKMEKEEHDNMSDSIEKFARDVAEEYAEEMVEKNTSTIISKLLRKGKDAEEVADLLDLDIDRVKSVEEGMLVNS